MSIDRTVERVAYFFLGNNAIIGRHIRRQIEFLRRNVPTEFKYKAMDDLGCGDGKVTLLLREVFSPRELRGFDINPNLVKRAKRGGIQAEVKNLEQEMPQGELAVVWGVLHHLKRQEDFLESITRNYRFIFIREPLKSHCFHGFELGRPLAKEKAEHLKEKYLPSSKLLYFEDNVMIFHDASKDI